MLFRSHLRRAAGATPLPESLRSRAGDAHGETRPLGAPATRIEPSASVPAGSDGNRWVLARCSRGFLRGRWSPLRRTFGSFSSVRKGTRGARRNALVILAAHRRLRSGFRPAGPGRMATPYGESKGVAKRQPEWGHHLSRRDKWRLWPSLNARRRSAALAAGEERI